MELKIPPVIQMLVLAISMWLVAILLPSLTFRTNTLLWLGGLVIVVGIVVVALGMFAFRNANTTVDPRSPEKASLLVTAGIYRFSRNPMYVGILLVLAGWALVLGSIMSLLFLPVFVVYINRFQIKPEEQTLSGIFNGDYAAYKASVRRWI